MNISSLGSLKERFKLYEGLAEKEYLVVPIEDIVRIVFGEAERYGGMEES